MSDCSQTTSENASTNSAASSDTIASVFAALSNPVRIDIMRHVAKHQYCCCKDITEVLPLAQSTISQHLKVLGEAGLIVMETVPPRSRYRVNEELLKDLSNTTSDFLNSCCKSDCN